MFSCITSLYLWNYKLFNQLHKRLRSFDLWSSSRFNSWTYVILLLGLNMSDWLHIRAVSFLCWWPTAIICIISLVLIFSAICYVPQHECKFLVSKNVLDSKPVFLCFSHKNSLVADNPCGVFTLCKFSILVLFFVFLTTVWIQSLLDSCT